MPYVLAVLVGALLALLVARSWRRNRIRRRFRRARQGEIEAEGLLEARGFTILDQQTRRDAHMFVAGVRTQYGVRADLLVSRRWRTYVVEVKTGKSAPDPRLSATRRQLLEYSLVYEADGLLLVDMSARDIHEIRFPARTTTSWNRRLTWILLGAALGAGLEALVSAL